MPSLRRRGQPSPSPQEVFSESDQEYVSAGASDDGQEPELDQQAEQELLSDEEQAGPLSPGSEPSEPPSPSHLSAALPPDFREISTLASWTVSSSKPGCSIPQLRHPSPNLFWQSDGPQPHYLNIHFFKLVRIVGLRLYLDFEQDESYTPTRIVLLAGSGMNDLVEWGEMRLESPRGWVWADFSGVGDPDDESGDESEGENEDGNGDGGAAAEVEMSDAHAAADTRWDAARDAHPLDDVSDFENTAPRPAATPATAPVPNIDVDTPQAQHHHHQPTPPTALPPHPRAHPRAPFATISPHAPTPARPAPLPKRHKLPALRCHLVQVKILENHQNGKDTHLRGLQVFARDGEKNGGREGREGGMRMGLGSGSGKEGRKGRGEGMGRVRELVGGGWMEEGVLR